MKVELLNCLRENNSANHKSFRDPLGQSVTNYQNYLCSSIYSSQYAFRTMTQLFCLFWCFLREVRSKRCLSLVLMLPKSTVEIYRFLGHQSKSVHLLLWVGVLRRVLTSFS